MKEIKDYLHLYLGCKVNYSGTICELFGVHKAYSVIGDFKKIGMVKIPIEDYIRLKPILRPLSDMTEEERKEAAIVRGDGDGFMNNVAEAHEFKYLLSKGFDLFGLIESGLAIDKKGGGIKTRGGIRMS